ncbi:MAG TPA: hypothetical protein VLF90_04735 [Patescibacteria group bacterium]|nr:hypothetical protein [Patescibacteria group bacterium]
MATNNKELSKGVGWIFFAGIMMIMSGFFQVLAGLTSLLRPTWYAVTSSNLLVFNYPAWGWIDLAIGFLVLMAGFSVLHGSTWARIVGVVLAVLSAIGALAFISAYPIWSVIVITIDVVVIHALVVHGAELKDS